MRGIKIVAIVGLAVALAGLGITANAQQSCAPTGPFRDWVFGSVGSAQRVVIAIDNSGSILQAGRLPTEKACATAIVQILSGKQFAILSFNSSVTVVQGLTTSTNTLIGAINSIQDTSNNTNIAAAINTACQFTQPVSPSGALVLLTDGIPTEPGPDPRGAAQAAAQNFRNNCSTLAVIGVDIQPGSEEERFLRGIANAYWPTTKTPTMTEWGLIALGLLLAGSLAWMIRRRVTVRLAGA